MAQGGSTRVVKVDLPKDLVAKIAADLGIKDISRIPAELHVVAVEPHSAGPLQQGGKLAVPSIVVIA